MPRQVSLMLAEKVEKMDLTKKKKFSKTNYIYTIPYIYYCIYTITSLYLFFSISYALCPF